MVNKHVEENDDQNTGQTKTLLQNLSNILFKTQDNTWEGPFSARPILGAGAFRSLHCCFELCNDFVVGLDFWTFFFDFLFVPLVFYLFFHVAFSILYFLSCISYNYIFYLEKIENQKIRNKSLKLPRPDIWTGYPGYPGRRHRPEGLLNRFATPAKRFATPAKVLRVLQNVLDIWQPAIRLGFL